MRLSLPVQFAVLSLLITLVGLVGITYFSYKSSDTLLQQQALERLGDDLKREREILKAKLEILVKDVHFLAESPGVHGIIRASQGEGYDDQENMTLSMWRERLTGIFRIVLQQRQTYTQVRFIGVANDGMEIVRLDRANTELVAAPPAKLQPKGKYDYFQKLIALKPGEIYISDITLNRKQGKVTYPPQPMLRIGIPIFTEQNEIFGIVIINADFNQLTASLTHAPEHIFYFLTNEQGDYLIHPEAQKRLAFEFNRQARYQHDFPIPKHSHSESQGEKYWWFLPELESGLALDYLSLDEWQQSGRFLRLGAVAKLSVLTQKSQALQSQLVLPVGVAAIILSLLTLVMARRLTRPVRLLTDAADQVASGKENVEIPVMGGNETTALGCSIKTMLDRLNSSREEMAELNHSLESQVQTRTQELEAAKETLVQKNAQLGSALEKAEEATVAKSRFLATMSHEIRTPLNGVLGMTELLLDTNVNEVQRDYLETVHASGETLMIVLNDILDFSKIEAGQFVLNEIEFNPNDIIEHVTHLYAKTAHNKDLEIIGFGLTTLGHLIKGDPDRMRQIMMNLVSNAIKFTDRGEVIVRIHTLEDSAHEISLRFEISDTGIGIAKEKQGHLFQQFVQIDSSSTRKHGGTGLGLTISRQLIELMGGKIGVESKEGKGSLFWFEITFPKGTQIPNNASFHRTDLSHWHALVVDDNTSNREILHHIVTSWGLGNGSVSSGPAALKKLHSRAVKGKPYELVLLDHMMPGMDGMEVAQKIKESPLLDKTKVIMLSSMGIPTSPKEMRDSGIDGYLCKPIKQMDLYNLILSVMGVNSFSDLSDGEHTHLDANNEQIPRPEQILVAEDTLINQRVITGMLKKLGFTPDIANNGNEAVFKWAASHYDLILMDIQMPIMDGYEATTQIRAQEKQAGKNNHIPIIALTAHAMDGDKERSLDSGMDGHLTKPIDTTALRETLAHWLPNKEADNAPTYALQHALGSDNGKERRILDHKVLQQLKEIVEEEINDIIEMFITGLPVAVNQMREAVADKDLKALQQAVHSLKGTSGNLGARRLHHSCIDLETGIDSSDFDTAIDLIATIEEEGVKVIKKLREELTF